LPGNGEGSDWPPPELIAPPPRSVGRASRSWHEAIVATDIVAEVRRPTAHPGKPLIAHGGASFARELVKHDLVDEAYGGGSLVTGVSRCYEREPTPRTLRSSMQPFMEGDL